jgi:hypothetical protein
MVDALAVRGDERRDSLRKASGRRQYPVIRRYLNGETHLVIRLGIVNLFTRQTGRSETSQYPEEKTSNEIPLVAASERGVADEL